MSDAVALPSERGSIDADEPSAPPGFRGRLRLAAVALAAATAALAWYGSASGLERIGAPGAFAIASAWGLAATLRLARTRRGLMIGAALTDAALAGLATALVASGHPWLPAADLRPTWIPIFGPLAALAAMDALVRARRAGGGEVAAIRGGAALVAAGAFVVAWQPLPAAVSLALAASPLATLLPRTARSARRALEALSVLAAVALYFAPQARDALTPFVSSGEVATVWALAYQAFAFLAFVASALGTAHPEPAAAPS